MGTHKNIIDFLYYSCVFNPSFVRLIIVVEKQKQEQNQQERQIIKQVFYAPLSHSQALKCALENRGFDPIIVRNEKEMKSIKYRKMAMKTLVTECFEELKGAIFILLPGLKINEHVQIERLVANDIYQNELRFVRSGVGLKVTFEDRQIYKQQFKSQTHFLLKLMSQPRINRICVNSFTYRNYRYQYSKTTYRNFIEENFFLLDKYPITHKKISYIEYIEQLDRQQKLEQEREENQMQKEKSK